MKPSSDVYRLARKPNPWAPMNWAWASFDGTFGNRYDDPQAIYRVLYASSQKLGCFLETLARFRVDPTLSSELAAITGEDDFWPTGAVPKQWLEVRAMGVAGIRGNYVEVCSSDWISHLKTKLAPVIADYGIHDLNASALQTTTIRKLTQLVSRIVFDSGADGIYYPSKYGHDVNNWALFEPFKIEVKAIETIRPDDSDLLRALRLHNLKLG